jgi:hypothetical protein
MLGAIRIDDQGASERTQINQMMPMATSLSLTYGSVWDCFYRDCQHSGALRLSEKVSACPVVDYALASRGVFRARRSSAYWPAAIFAIAPRAAASALATASVPCGSPWRFASQLGSLYDSQVTSEASSHTSTFSGKSIPIV